MSHQVNIHQTQITILRELLFKPKAGFAELMKAAGLESDYFKYHISKLVELGFVEKSKNKEYRLTQKGKEHANQIDTEARTIEKQPKVSVLLLVEKEQESGNKMYLFQQRLKHPYYGYWGIPGGKVTWGETIYQAAARELLEETGLTAEIEFVGIYHEHSSDKSSGQLLEDKVFFVMKCINPIGELIEEFEGGKNQLMTIEQTRTLDKKYQSFDFELQFALGLSGQDPFCEKQQLYSEDEF